MAPCLEELPHELFEEIVALLGFADICSLRRCCRALAEKATQDRFKSFYRSKTVDIAPKSLTAFVEVTRSNGLGCLVEELTLVGLAYHTDRQERHDFSDMELEIDLLKEAFGSIATSQRSGSSLSLLLEVAVIQHGEDRRILPVDVPRGGWKSVWSTTAQTFHTTMLALAASKLPLESFNVFDAPQLQCCSLACDELNHVNFQDDGLQVSLSTLKVLSISLSDRIIDLRPTEFGQRHNTSAIRVAEEMVWAKDNFTGLFKMFAHTAAIESIEIHYYRLNTLQYPQISGTHHGTLLSEFATLDKLPSLKNCRLRGIHVKQSELLTFLQKTSPLRLTMDSVTIITGTFEPILDYCTSETGGIEELHLNRLIENQEVLYFDPPNQVGPGQNLPLQSTSSTRPLTSLQRIGKEVRQSFIWNDHIRLGMAVDTPQKRALVQQRRKEYGPPWML